MLANETWLKRRSKAQKLALIKARYFGGKRSEEGLTLLECLVSIMVVSAVISAIIPPIFLTVAMRSQNSKATQARQLAQAQVDQVRSLVEKGDYNATELNKIAPVEVGGSGEIKGATPSLRTATPDQRVDINGDGRYDFWVQTFRNNAVTDPPTDPNGKPVAFKLGVRVYAYFEGHTPNPVAIDGTIQSGSLKFTTAQGSQRNQPLVAIYNDVSLSDTQNSLCTQRRLLGEAPTPLCPL